MGAYKQCPTCGNTRKHDNVYVCGNCGHFFCKNCRDNHCFGPLGLFEDPKCPRCREHSKIRIVGFIEGFDPQW